MAPTVERDATDALVRDLADAGFTAGGVSAFLGAPAAGALARFSPAPALAVCEARPGHPLATLVPLLWLGMPVPLDEAASALPALGPEGLSTLGLASSDGTALTPSSVVRSHRLHAGSGFIEMLIASDLDELSGIHPLRDDHVLGVGGAARTLLATLPDGRLGRALDLGTGCAVVAIALAERADSVVATDISERAIRYAKLNAALNSVDSIDFRLGSLYEPVAEEQFDLIASNPPFVISPRTDAGRYEYRDAGMRGDALMQIVLEGSHEHLRPQGHLRMLGNWEDGAERASSWVPGGLSGLVIERERLDPARYAEIWTRDGGTPPASEDGIRRIGSWVADFAERDVESVSFGWFALQRSPGGVRVESLQHPIALEGVSASLSLALREIADPALDEELLGSMLVASPDITESRHARPGAAGPNVIELRQGGWLQRTVQTDTAFAAFVGACDGTLTAGQIAEVLASLLEVDADALRIQLLEQVREGLRTGMLLRD